jgi:purine-binding chemotaxis protein CheW
MDYEYDDEHRPTDRAGEHDRGDQSADPGLFADEFVFEAPDLATAFLAALDAVDDRRFVTPPPDILAAAFPTEFPPVAEPPAPAPPAEDANMAESTTPDAFALEASAPELIALEPGVLEPIAPDAIAPDAPSASSYIPASGYIFEAAINEPAIQAYLERTASTHGAIEHEPAPSETPAPEYAVDPEQAVYTAPPASHAVEVEHEHPAGMGRDDSPSGRAAAEAFAREQAALELWGSDPIDESETLASDDTPELAPAPETFAAAPYAADEPYTAASVERDASVDADIDVDVDVPGDFPQAELIAETVSNADSYYDPDTLALARPLFSPDDPSAFAAPVYVGEAPADESAAADVEAELDPEIEVLEDLEEFVAFSLGDTRCVIPIRNVIEIGRIPDAVAVPNAPAWLHGLGNLRGQVLSLIDLRAFLGIGRVRPATGRMLVLRADDEEVQAGLLVDHVHQIVSLSASRFHALPETLPQHYSRHAWGVCEYGTFTMIGLDVDSLLGVESLTPAEPAVEAEAV